MKGARGFGLVAAILVVGVMSMLAVNLFRVLEYRTQVELGQRAATDLANVGRSWQTAMNYFCTQNTLPASLSLGDLTLPPASTGYANMSFVYNALPQPNIEVGVDIGPVAAAAAQVRVTQAMRSASVEGNVSVVRAGGRVTVTVTRERRTSRVVFNNSRSEQDATTVSMNISGVESFDAGGC